MKPSYCAPGHDQGFTCFTLEQLQEFTQKLIQHHPDAAQQIGGNWKSKSQKDLHSFLTHYINKKYGKIPESDYLKLPFVREAANHELINETFRPAMPNDWKNDPKTWLTTDDISKVMIQYQNKFPDFVFFGPVASDCPEEYPCELSGFSCQKLMSAGIKRIGIVFNLDKHNQSGSHWVAVWISIPEKAIEYYDSYAVRPPRLIHQFLKRVQSEAAQQGIPMEIIINQTRHQYGGSECGVFSMYYILQRLHGKSREQTVKKKPTDKLMNQLRLYLFRPSNDIRNSAEAVVREIPVSNLPNRGGNRRKQNTNLKKIIINKFL